MKTNIQAQKGVALIQSIVLAAIMSIIALYLNASARESVKQAQLLSDRARATVQLYQTEAELLFSVFTEELQSGSTENGYFHWRFDGQPFEGSEGTVIGIQDEAGLLGLYPLRSTLLQSAIRKLGYSREQAITVVNSLLDWQDSDSDVREGSSEESGYRFGPRNKPMTEVQELNWIPQIPNDLRPQLEQLLTVNTPKYFNPANAPEALLKAYLELDQLPTDIERFRSGELQGQTFSEVAGVDLEEGINFATSSSLRVTIHSTKNEASVAKQMTVVIERYSDNPENVLKTLNRFWGQRALNHLYEHTNTVVTDEKSL